MTLTTTLIEVENYISIKGNPNAEKIMHKRLLLSSLYIVLHRENIRLDI